MTHLLTLGLALVGVLALGWCALLYGVDGLTWCRRAVWACLPHEHFSHGGSRVVTREGRLGEHGTVLPLTGHCHRCGRTAPARFRRRR